MKSLNTKVTETAENPQIKTRNNYTEKFSSVMDLEEDFIPGIDDENYEISEDIFYVNVQTHSSEFKYLSY